MTPLAADLLILAAIYRLSARALAKELDDEALQDLRRLDPLLPHEPDDPLRSSIRDLDDDDAILETSVEYCRLFIGPRPVLLPYPDGSASHRGPARQARADMAAILSRHQFHVKDTTGLEQDHIAIWLTIIADLHTTAASSGQANGSRQALAALRDIADSAVAEWLNLFLQELAVAARTWPYRPIARAAIAALNATTCIVLNDDDAFSKLP